MTKNSSVDNRVTNAIALTITAVWAASFIADILVPDYNPSPFIHMMMMGLAGAIFGRSFMQMGGGQSSTTPTGEEKERQ